MIETKDNFGGFVGDYSWQTMRDVLIFVFKNCKTEEAFMSILKNIFLSIGTPEELAERRSKLGIHQFTEEDKKTIEELRENVKIKYECDTMEELEEEFKHLEKYHDCEKSRGKIVGIVLDDLGNTMCGYCGEKVKYPKLKEGVFKKWLEEKRKQNG